MSRRLFTFLVILLVLPSLVLLPRTAPCRASLLSSLKNDINNLSGQYKSLQQRKNQTQQKVQNLQSQADSLQGQLTDLNKKISVTNTGITSRQKQIAQLDTSIAAIMAKIASNEAKQAQDQQKFNNILVGVYENGPVSYLQVVFGARDFADFLTRLNYMGSILSYERSVLTTLLADHRTLAGQETSLGAARQAQADAVSGLNQLRSSQVQLAARKHTLLSQVQAAKQQELADLNSENKAMQLLSSQLQELQRKYASLTGKTVLGAWVWPVPDYHHITSPYGWRYIFGHREFHNGIDIGAPYGATIVAANNGVVLYAGAAEGFGHWIVIEHKDGLMSVYGHMYASGIYVHPGEVVQAGQKIAVVGADGDATGPHLHFSVITGFNSQGYMISVNPLKYVSP